MSAQTTTATLPTVVPPGYVLLARGMQAFENAGRRESCNRFKQQLQNFTGGRNAQYWQARTLAAEALLASENVQTPAQYWQSRALRAERVLPAGTGDAQVASPYWKARAQAAEGLLVPHWDEVKKGEEKICEAIGKIKEAPGVSDRQARAREEQKAEALKEELRCYFRDCGEDES